MHRPWFCNDGYLLSRTGRHCTHQPEFYPLVSATNATLGMRSMLRDWGWNFKGEVLKNAGVGISIRSRRGLGSVMHIDTPFIRVQEFTTSNQHLMRTL